MALTAEERKRLAEYEKLDTRTDEQKAADDARHEALVLRVMALHEAVNPQTPDELGRMLETMTPEERRIHRRMSELGTLPGDSGGGWDVLYVPDEPEESD
jgi:hypothetical protein